EWHKDGFVLTYHLAQHQLNDAGFFVKIERSHHERKLSFDYEVLQGKPVELVFDFVARGRLVESKRVPITGLKGTIVIERAGARVADFDQLNVMCVAPHQQGRIQISLPYVEDKDGQKSTIEIKGNIPLDPRSKDTLPGSIAKNLITTRLQKISRRNDFAMEIARIVGNFIRVAVVPETQLTRDGVQFDVSEESGLFRRHWTAPSKETFPLALAGLAMSGNNYALLMLAKPVFEPAMKRYAVLRPLPWLYRRLVFSAKNKAAAKEIVAAMLAQKVTSYENINQRYPELGGFLPWINPETL